MSGTVNEQKTRIFILRFIWFEPNKIRFLPNNTKQEFSFFPGLLYFISKLIQILSQLYLLLRGSSK